MGPIPISSGSQPAMAKPLKIPSGASPRSRAVSAFITTTAAAPSLSCEALPAVMTPPSITGLSLARPSRVVSGRLPSSSPSVTSLSEISPVALSCTFMVAVMGTISWSNLPACCAAAVRCWLWRAYSSWASRLMP